MVTLGNGATAQVRADIASMGSNLLTVMPGQRVGPGGASGSAKPFRRQDVDALSVRWTRSRQSPRWPRSDLSVISGAKNRSTTVTGTTNAYFESGNWQLASGRFFSDSELRSGAAVCIIGETTRKELLGSARSDRRPAPAALAVLQRHRTAASRKARATSARTATTPSSSRCGRCSGG